MAQIKWTVSQVKKTPELNPTDILYTKRIIPFMKKVTRETILDDLELAGLLTTKIQRIIER